MLGRCVAVALVLCASMAAAQMSMSAEEEEMLAEMGVSGQPMGCGSAPARAARRARSFRVCATRDTAWRRHKNQEPQAEPIKSDLKYIYCGVCRKMVDIALPKSQELLANRFKFKKRRR